MLLDCVIYCACYSIFFRGGGRFFRTRCSRNFVTPISSQKTIMLVLSGADDELSHFDTILYCGIRTGRQTDRQTARRINRHFATANTALCIHIVSRGGKVQRRDYNKQTFSLSCLILESSKLPIVVCRIVINTRRVSSSKKHANQLRLHVAVL